MKALILIAVTCCLTLVTTSKDTASGNKSRYGNEDKSAYLQQEADKVLHDVGVIDRQNNMYWMQLKSGTWVRQNKYASR